MISKRVKVVVVAIAAIIVLTSLSFWVLSRPSVAPTEAEKIIIHSSNLNELGNWHDGDHQMPYPYKDYPNQTSNATNGIENGTLEVGVVIVVFNSTLDCLAIYDAIHSNFNSHNISFENVSVGEAGMAQLSLGHVVEIYFVRGNVFADIWVDSGHSGVSIMNLTEWTLNIATIQDSKIQSFYS